MKLHLDLFVFLASSRLNFRRSTHVSWPLEKPRQLDGWGRKPEYEYEDICTANLDNSVD